MFKEFNYLRLLMESNKRLLKFMRFMKGSEKFVSWNGKLKEELGFGVYYFSILNIDLKKT